MENSRVNKKRDIIFTAVFAAVVFGLSFVLDSTINPYIKRVLNLSAIYAIVSLSMNLMNGFTGQFSLGQAGFMAIGAYTVGIFTLPIEVREQIYYMVPMHSLIANIELPIWAALLLGGLIAALFAFIIGTPILRLKGDYLAIATLGFSEIIRIVLTNAQSVTNGSLGITRIPSTTSMPFFFGFLIITVIIIGLLITSSYGRAFKAIREDEIAAEAMGIGLLKHKLMAFVISAFFAAIGGGLYATFLATVDPKNFLFTLTYNFLLIIVLGGLGSISGTVISAFIVTGGLEVLRFFDEPLSLFGMNIPIFRPGFRMVIFAIILIAIVLFWPKGLMGKTELTWDRVLRRKKNVKGEVK